MKKFEFNTFLVIALIVLFSVSAYAATVILGPSTTQTTATTSSGTVFARNLSMGMTGQDVSALNAILDIEFNTIIPSSNIFSGSTQSYLLKLQQRYGLTPTGSANSTTTSKLNALAQEYHITLAQFPAPQTSSISYPQIFTQTLSLGSVSDQVALLKTVLNSDPSTQLLYTNASELANPVNLFDTATQIAVNKFQQKYASDILTPSGLIVGNGIVGPSTRAKLNQILAKNISSSATTNTTNNIPTTNYNVPVTNNNQTNSCTSDTWGCSDWSSCSNGTQTRQCSITYACSNPGANHNLPYATSQTCTPTPTPTPKPIPGGTTVATGYVDSCSSIPASTVSTGYVNICKDSESCAITSGSATCSNGDIICPSGSVLATTTSNYNNFLGNGVSCTATSTSSTNFMGNSSVNVQTYTYAGSRISYSCETSSIAATKNCVITSGNATCSNDTIICPSGSNLTRTGNSQASCPNSNPSSTGNFPFFSGNSRISYSCVTPSNSTQSSGGSNSSNSGCGGIIGCVVSGVGSIVGGVVSGVGSIIGGILSIF